MSASIPLGLAVGIGTVLLTNLLEITDLSIYPSPNFFVKIVSSIWIVLFFIYFSSRVGRASGKGGDATGLASDLIVKPLLLVAGYFALLLGFGLFARL